MTLLPCLAFSSEGGITDILETSLGIYYSSSGTFVPIVPNAELWRGCYTSFFFLRIYENSLNFYILVSLGKIPIPLIGDSEILIGSNAKFLFS